MRIMVWMFSCDEYVTRCGVYKVMSAAIQPDYYFKLCRLARTSSIRFRQTGSDPERLALNAVTRRLFFCIAAQVRYSKSDPLLRNRYDREEMAGIHAGRNF
jgi:hypothetical protein